MTHSPRRYRVAISYSGARRDYVAKVASSLSRRLGDDTVFFDRDQLSKTSGKPLHRVLPKIYAQSDLVVVVACPRYNKSEYTRVEWDTIFHLYIRPRSNKRVMLCRFEGSEVEGAESAGYVDLDSASPKQTAEMILGRLAENEGNPKEHYQAKPTPMPKPTKHAPKKSKSGVHIIVPVGPCEVDIAKMPSVHGVKLLASLCRKPILFHLLERWSKHAASIEKVSFILNDGGLEQGDAKKRACDDLRDLLNRASSKYSDFKDKLETIDGGKDESPTETLCECARSRDFPSRFLLHYCDVWPAGDDDLYAALLKYAQPQSPHEIHDGVLACATKIPRDLFSPARLPANHGDIVANVLGLVSKPFHVVEIDGLVKGHSSHRIHHRYANMAIAVLTRRFLTEINSAGEMFQLIGNRLSDGCFSAHVFAGDWIHCDTDHDVSIINAIGHV